MNILHKIQSKIVTQSEATRIVKEWQNSGNSVVFTNGCFDIVHKGHVFYLHKARELGNKMVLGLNSDSSVKNIKGENRPVKEQESRALTLAAFECVDLIVLFDEDTPFNVIKELQPNILVKGKDYNENEIVGADIVKKNGGKVITIDLEDGYSSSNYIEKL